MPLLTLSLLVQAAALYSKRVWMNSLLMPSTNTHCSSSEALVFACVTSGMTAGVIRVGCRSEEAEF